MFPCRNITEEDIGKCSGNVTDIVKEEIISDCEKHQSDSDNSEVTTTKT